MSDIFDEVDDILSEVTDEMAETSGGPNKLDEADSAKGFNDSELQDIMAEIESLEKEFETDTEIAEPIMAEPIVVPVAQTELQSEIDRELEMSMVEKEEEELEQASKVLAFEKTTTPMTSETVVSEVTPVTGAQPEISFEAHGSMNLNLGFKIGEENAKLTIDPVKGLTVSLSGVKLTITASEGCCVVMDNGVKFTVPMNTSQIASGKKAA